MRDHRSMDAHASEGAAGRTQAGLAGVGAVRLDDSPLPPEPVAADRDDWIGYASVGGALLGGLPGVVLGLIGLRAARRGTSRTRSWGLAGTMLGTAVAVALTVGAASAVTGAFDSGRLGGVSAAELTVGQCYDLPEDALLQGFSEDVQGFNVVDCLEPHRGQVYQAGVVHLDDYPGFEQMRADVEGWCTRDDVTGMLTQAALAKVVEVYFPSAASFADGDRGWACGITESGAEWIGSALVGAG